MNVKLRYPPWHTAVVTVLVGPLLGLLAAYFNAKKADAVGEAGKQHWQTWAITSAVMMVLYLAVAR